MFICEELIDNITEMIPSFEQDLNKIKLDEFTRPNTCQGKRLEVMIENFYEFDNSLKEQMIEEVCFLKRVIHCWRAVVRDGNCFYRSVACLFGISDI